MFSRAIAPVKKTLEKYPEVGYFFEGALGGLLLTIAVALLYSFVNYIGG